MPRRPTTCTPDPIPRRTASRPPASRPLATALALLLAAAVPAHAQTPTPAPVAAPAAPERHVGKMVFAELVTPDLAAAERFYGGLFGWTFRTSGTGRAAFTQASSAGQVVAGLIQRDLPQGRSPAWLTCLATTDVDATDATALQHGAKMLYGPYDVAAIGRESVLADPQGAVFGLLAATAGDPPERLAARGAWIWSSVIATDPETDAAFYKSLLGYEIYPLADPDDARHLILASGDFARASVNPPPSERPGLHPRWLSYVRVDDVAASAAQAASLGGKVLVEPHVDRHGGRIAVVADPSGAPFGLMEWSEDSGNDVGDVK